MIGPNDPEWASDIDVPEAKLWEKRAKAQLERARIAEKEVEIVKREARKNRDVQAVGGTILDALVALGEENGWGTVDPSSLTDLDYDPGDFDWGSRFRAGNEDGWTGFKAAGRRLPGGYTVTWWK